MNFTLFFRLVLFFLCFIATKQAGWAQTEVIAVDTTTGVPAKSLPFNKSFILKIPAKQTSYSGLYLIDHIGNRTLFETIQKRTIERFVDPSGITQTLSKNYNPRLIPSSYYFTAKEGAKNNLYIRFKDTLTLRPSKQYSLVVIVDPDTQTQAIFDNLHEAAKLTGTDEAIRRKKAKFVSKGMVQYKTIADAIREQYGFYFGLGYMNYVTENDINTIGEAKIDNDGLITDDPVSIGGITKSIGKKRVDEIVSFHKSTLETLYNKIDVKEDSLRGHINDNWTRLPQGRVANQIVLLNEAYLRIDTLANSKLRDQFIQDNNRGLRLINKLTILSETESRQILSGIQPILCDLCKLTDPTSYSGRVKNIEETITDLQRVRLLAQVLASQNPQLNQAASDLSDALNVAIPARTFLVGLNKQITSIRDAIKNSGKFNGAEITNTDTFVFSFDTRNKFSIVPEVGLVTNRLFASGQSSNYLLIPYLGASINFSQLDRDVPFKLIRRKTLWQRLAFVVGYSVVPLKDDNVSAPRDDFFEKSSLLTGLGFRFSNSIKLVSGFTWYYKRPASVDESRQLTSLPFVGLAFDIDIKKSLETIFSAVTPLRSPKVVETKTE